MYLIYIMNGSLIIKQRKSLKHEFMDSLSSPHMLTGINDENVVAAAKIGGGRYIPAGFPYYWVEEGWGSGCASNKRDSVGSGLQASIFLSPRCYNKSNMETCIKSPACSDSSLFHYLNIT